MCQKLKKYNKNSKVSYFSFYTDKLFVLLDRKIHFLFHSAIKKLTKNDINTVWFTGFIVPQSFLCTFQKPTDKQKIFEKFDMTVHIKLINDNQSQIKCKLINRRF